MEDSGRKKKNLGRGEESKGVSRGRRVGELAREEKTKAEQREKKKVERRKTEKVEKEHLQVRLLGFSLVFVIIIVFLSFLPTT